MNNVYAGKEFMFRRNFLKNEAKTITWKIKKKEGTASSWVSFCRSLKNAFSLSFSMMIRWCDEMKSFLHSPQWTSRNNISAGHITLYRRRVNYACAYQTFQIFTQLGEDQRNVASIFIYISFPNAFFYLLLSENTYILSHLI